VGTGTKYSAVSSSSDVELALSEGLRGGF